MQRVPVAWSGRLKFYSGAHSQSARIGPCSTGHWAEFSSTWSAHRVRIQASRTSSPGPPQISQTRKDRDWATPMRHPHGSASGQTPLDAGKPTHLLPSTRWHFVTNANGFKKEQMLEFEDGGNLATNPPSTVGVSTWEQSADEVRIFINDRYAVSRGKFVDADHMQGTGGNKVGATWTWTADRR